MCTKEPLSVKDQRGLARPQVRDGKIYLSKLLTGRKTQKIYYRKCVQDPNETVHDLQIFNEEFVETLEILQSKRQQIYLCGDYNIDLLNIFQKNQYNNLFENLITAGLQPNISLPTR